MGHALKCFLFMFSLVLLACRREGSTHDDTQEDVITTAVWPLHSLYGVWRQDVGVVECLFQNKKFLSPPIQHCFCCLQAQRG
ncbi:hypothetical protein QL093DRAFT_2227498 [Fusarium oxysporum]|nr:hypothetical protein QL093DRAFT_2227498 [Fusarium oxysporum]